jgi:hypothetical protein
MERGSPIGGFTQRGDRRRARRSRPRDGTARLRADYASARSLQIGDAVAVIAVTSVAANLSTILAGLAVFGDRLGSDALEVGVRIAAFALILVGAALIPAPVRAGEALEESATEPGSATAVTLQPTVLHRERASARV